MNKHLIICCLGYFALGVAICVSISDEIAEMSHTATICIFVPCALFFLYAVLFHLDELKRQLQNKDK